MRQVIEGNGLVDERIYLAGFVEVDQGFVRAADQIRHHLGVEALVHADDRVVLHEGVVCRGVGDPATRDAAARARDIALGYVTE